VLDKKPDHVGGRLCIVNKNEAGVLGQITTFLGSKNLNIEQQINTSRGDIAYTVIDFGKVEDPASLQVNISDRIWAKMGMGMDGAPQSSGVISTCHS
jgi:D-3-phosphoglycerate dehydrogenase